MRHGLGAQPTLETLRKNDLHLPDAPSNRARSPRRLPDLRHAARTQGSPRGRRWRRPRDPRSDAKVLDRRRAHPARFHHRHGALDSRLPHREIHPEECVEMDRVRPCHAGGLLGRRNVLHQSLALAEDLESQHVHADRDRSERGFYLQRGRGNCSRDLSRILPGTC
jgi:hypothetical protein